MRNLLRISCGATLALALASSAGATPFDMADTTDRDSSFAINFGNPSGVLVGDPGALMVMSNPGAMTFDVPGDGVQFTMPAVDWTSSLIAVFGESPDPVTCGSGAPAPDCTTEGVIAATVSDYTVNMVLSTGDSDPAFPDNWTAAVVFNLPIGPGVLLPLLLTGRDTDFAAVAAQGGDWFFPDATTALDVSCAEAAVPDPVACVPANYRGNNPYDGLTGRFGFLAVVDNGFIDPTWTPQGGAFCETLANGGDDTDCDTIPDATDPCLTFHNTDLTDSNGDGIPNNCQCGDTNADGFVVSVDAFNMVSCLVDPLCVAGPVDTTIWDTNNDGFVVSIDAFNAVNAAFVTMTPYTLTCSRRPEGTPPP